MPQFTYKARRRNGEVVTGVLDVPDRSAALAQIERLGLLPVMVDQPKGGVVVDKAPRKGASAPAAAGAAALLPPGLRDLFFRQRRPKLQEIATFTQQLANLLHSGMPLTVALNSMTHLESKGIPADVSRQLRQDVTEGRSLSDAMARQPVIFSDMYVNMVRAGEQSGALVDVLRRLAEHYHRFAEVQAKFVSALIYPAVVTFVGIGIIIFFMTFMLPKFKEIFEGIKVPLPRPTQILMQVGDLMVSPSFWVITGIVISALAVLFMRFKNSPGGRRALDSWKLRLPVFGQIFRLNLYAQFARVLATLLQNGVPVLTALKITEQVIPNQVLKEAIAQTREAVTDGKTLAQPLARSKVFPQLMIDLIKIGEETGDVPGALRNLADTYENELSLALRVMTNLIEPVMIIVMAVGVGLLLFSILSAMFEITNSIGRG
ncbi:type II secretion system F family protein [Fontisphaera persica]|jgi:type II secretory pathway component PulF|uniref:type II secretion system F family protein n=1 Tax=Fontisphaera persica TaxID=2974023 RepID=UPI0024BF250F|nr:type II secretion system F family protein [Fontisphaera persica]WCJ58034.1 type II secretion system F family protein [Fontisphaera persica]